MNAVDTNVLIYRVDHRDPIKQAKARQLLRQLASTVEPTVLPWQVLGACIEAHIETLYTEDMGAPTTYDSVRLLNPFS